MSRKQQPFINAYDGVFDRNSPRPPVPGEERVHCTSDWGQMDYYPPHYKSQQAASSPTPRKSHYNQNDLYGLSEYEGKQQQLSGPSSSCVRQERLEVRTPDDASPPACLRWATSLHRLLEDPDGVELFKRYLQAEGRPHADALDFWFACEGLKKQTERDRVLQLVKVIYKRFFLKSALPIPEETKREMGRRVKVATSAGIDASNTLFDEAQAQVEDLINITTYPNFIKSDMYLQYIQSVQNPTGSSGELSSESSSSSSSISNKDPSTMACSVGPLPIIHEDEEFVPAMNSGLSHTPGTAGYLSTGYQTPNLGAVRLTKDMLLATQRNRAMDVRPKPEAFAADMYMYRGTPANGPPHLAYNSYNPVSRQDSEMQSLSSHSDARTESDNMSLTDSSIDGRSLQRSSKRKAALEARHARESAALNRETHMHQTLIPRTQRMDKQQCQPLHPEQFATILIQKLESLKRDQDTQEMLERKLKESDSLSSLNNPNYEKSRAQSMGNCDKARSMVSKQVNVNPGCNNRMNEAQSRELAIAIREKLQLEDDNDQDILDQHVSRVFSDLTPRTRSPGVLSPRPHSPTRTQRYSSSRIRRKDKDGFSTFSSDSGNIHDFPDACDLKLSKSKSMPEYPEERFARGSAGRRSSSSKKTLTDFTDSGVSVVSDTPPVSAPQGKDSSRVLAWLMESDRGVRQVGSGGYSHSEMSSSKHRGHRSSSATSPNANRHRKGYGSRSSSLERSSASSSCLGPAQPFVADPSMPPLPQPNTAVQLEEARRRLMEDDLRTRSRQRSSSKHYPPELSQSSQSTLRKSMRGPRQSTSTSDDVTTTVVFSFCDEQFPYRTKIPGRQVTLRQFKEYLPKKGNYRYFFKTECEELDNQVIQEEVSNDADVLPLWEGRINAQVKPID